MSKQTPGGVIIEFKKQTGEGKNKPKPGDRVKIHYTGTLMNGKQFDSSRNRPDPFECQIGVGQVIKGWDEAIPELCVGDRAILTIPPHMAYGERGFSNLIPPNSPLIFDVELVGIQ
ncbi:FK506-binding protein 1 [Rhizoctonia solani]|nr:FK506-binding protein 1 [Rhizoctonia solani]